jgi:hypothetical protein
MVKAKAVCFEEHLNIKNFQFPEGWQYLVKATAVVSMHSLSHALAGLRTVS